MMPSLDPTTACSRVFCILKIIFRYRISNSLMIVTVIITLLFTQLTTAKHFLVQVETKNNKLKEKGTRYVVIYDL